MLAEPDVVADVLGLRSARTRTTPFWLISSIEAGLPVAALERLARAMRRPMRSSGTGSCRKPRSRGARTTPGLA